MGWEGVSALAGVSSCFRAVLGCRVALQEGAVVAAGWVRSSVPCWRNRRRCPAAVASPGSGYKFHLRLREPGGVCWSRQDAEEGSGTAAVSVGWQGGRGRRVTAERGSPQKANRQRRG